VKIFLTSCLVIFSTASTYAQTISGAKFQSILNKGYSGFGESSEESGRFGSVGCKCFDMVTAELLFIRCENKAKGILKVVKIRIDDIKSIEKSNDVRYPNEYRLYTHSESIQEISKLCQSCETYDSNVATTRIDIPQVLINKMK
jgi:hypothetical protein